MFEINGILWRIFFCDPRDAVLYTGRTGFTLGVTDRELHMVFLSSELYGEKLRDVLMHEICHCFVYSYGIEIDVDDEECMCQFLEHYGEPVTFLTDEILRGMYD